MHCNTIILRLHSVRVGFLTELHYHYNVYSITSITTGTQLLLCVFYHSYSATVFCASRLLDKAARPAGEGEGALLSLILEAAVEVGMEVVGAGMVGMVVIVFKVGAVVVLAAIVVVVLAVLLALLAKVGMVVIVTAVRIISLVAVPIVEFDCRL